MHQRVVPQLVMLAVGLLLLILAFFLTIRIEFFNTIHGGKVTGSMVLL